MPGIDCRQRDEKRRVPELVIPNLTPERQIYTGKEKWRNNAKPDQIRLIENQRSKGKFIWNSLKFINGAA